MSEDFIKALHALEALNDKIKNMDKVVFMSFVGVLIDTLAAMHNKTSEETLSLFEDLCKVAADVHDEEGMMKV